jgi:L-ectoine synthase
MILRNLEDAERSDRRVVAENWESVRLLLKGDCMGFSFHITTIYPGTETHIWYKNHLESVYCIEGEGEVEVLDGTDDGGVAYAVRFDEPGGVEQASVIYRIAPGTIYVLDKNDRHILRAKTTMKLACVFNPPLNGREIHDEDGAYPLDGEEIAG